MSVEKIQDEGQTLLPPVGKTLGIVDSPEQLGAVIAGLKQAGYSTIKTLQGDEGAQILERSQGVFWGDAEGPVLRRLIDALKAGRIAFSVENPSSKAFEVGALASELGARFLVHFGMVSVTRLEK